MLLAFLMCSNVIKGIRPVTTTITPESWKFLFFNCLVPLELVSQVSFPLRWYPDSSAQTVPLLSAGNGMALKGTMGHGKGQDRI